MTDDTQAAHTALYRRVSDHLAVTAGKLQRLDKGPPLTALDVAGLFASTAASVLQGSGVVA